MSEKQVLEERLEECTDDDAFEARGFEIEFAIPVMVTQEHQAALMALITKIVEAPYNQPRNGLHWVGSSGVKAIMSDVDSKLLGKKPTTDTRKPENGEEPVHDDDVFSVDSCARPFLDGNERDQTLLDRRKKYCKACKGEQMVPLRGGVFIHCPNCLE